MKLADLKGTKAPRFLSRKQVCVVLNCSPPSLYRYQREGLIAPVPDTPHPMFDFAEVAMLAARMRLLIAEAIDRPELLLDDTA